MTRELDIRTIDFSAFIKSGDTVLWGQGGAEPFPLTQALMKQRYSIGDFKVFLGISFSATPSVEYTDRVTFSSYCGTGTNRTLSKAGRLNIVPSHYSELSPFLERRVDVLMLQLPPADQDGRYSFGIAHEYLVPLIDSARVVIAEVNDQCPWTYGGKTIAESDLDIIVRTSRAPLELKQHAPNETHIAIANNAAALIEDHATLQLGLGILPDVVLASLRDRRDLGIHSGMVGDTTAELMTAGVITNARKNIDTGVSIAGIMLGGRPIYEFSHRNPTLQFRSSEYTHSREVLGRIERFVAVNSAIEVDLTGQINAEVADGIYIGAIGGADDFLRAAQHSKGGVPLIVLPSIVQGNGAKKSRITADLKGPASISRSNAPIIVTEFGVADLRGLSLNERCKRMIDIAHPDFRENLERAARKV